MGLFSPKVKAEHLESALIQLQEQIVENGKLRTQIQLEIENRKQLSDNYAEQVRKIMIYKYNYKLRKKKQIKLPKSIITLRRNTKN